MTPTVLLQNYSQTNSRALLNPTMVTASESDMQQEEKDVFDGWWQYPSNVVLEPSTVNLQSYSDRMSDARPGLFCGSSLETDVEIIDLRGRFLHDALTAVLNF
jgi:hypothetical protein